MVVVCPRLAHYPTAKTFLTLTFSEINLPRGTIEAQKKRNKQKSNPF
jgi:hypothetical protein